MVDIMWSANLLFIYRINFCLFQYEFWNVLNQPIGLCSSRWLLLLCVWASLWEHGWKQISSFRWWRFCWNGEILQVLQHFYIWVLQYVKKIVIFNLISFLYFYSSSQQYQKWLLQNIVEWRFSDYLSLPTKWSLRNAKKEMALIMPVTLKFSKMSNSLGKWIFLSIIFLSVFHSKCSFFVEGLKYVLTNIDCLFLRTKNWNDSVFISFYLVQYFITGKTS